MTIAGLAALAALSAAQGMTNVGRIVIDQYKLVDANFPITVGPGARLIAHFEPNENFERQTCCKRENLRWIQTYFADPRVGGVSPPFPDQNRPIIDPRKDQRVPGAPTGKGDDLPFYDLTYPTFNDVDPNTNVLTNGSGVYYQDTPRVEPGQIRENVRVRLTTALVCVEERRMCVLGGFRWGFDVKNPGPNTLLPIGRMSEAEVRNNPFTSFNTALRADFPSDPQWTMLGAYRCGCMNWMNVEGVPEPSSLLALGGMAIMVVRRKRRYR